MLWLAALFAPQLQVRMTEQEFAQKIEERLPYRVDGLAIAVTIHAASIQLREDGDIAVDARFSAEGLTLEGQGRAKVASKLRFKRGEFYLSDLSRESIEFTFSENSDETLSEINSTLNNILLREADEADASDDDARIERVKSAKTYFETQLRGDAVKALDRFLATFPVYDMKDEGGALTLAALALERVEISEDEVLATLSIGALVVNLLTSGTAILIFFVVLELWPRLRRWRA